MKAIAVINPGNPTGAILNADTIKKVIEFSVKNKLVIIADEVIVFFFRSTVKIYTNPIRSLCLSEESLKQWVLNIQITVNWLHYIQFPKDFLVSAE